MKRLITSVFCKPLISALLVIATTAISFDVLARDQGGRHTSRGPAMSGSMGHGHSKNHKGHNNININKNVNVNVNHGGGHNKHGGGHHDHHEYYKDHREWHEDRWHYAVGAALTVATFRALTCPPTTVYLGGVTYYRCGPTWYARGYRGGSVTYIVTKAPPGY